MFKNYASAILTVAHDDSLRRRLGEESKRVVMENYLTSHVKEDFEKLVDLLVARRRENNPLVAGEGGGNISIEKKIVALMVKFELSPDKKQLVFALKYSCAELSHITASAIAICGSQSKICVGETIDSLAKHCQGVKGKKIIRFEMTNRMALTVQLPDGSGKELVVFATPNMEEPLVEVVTEFCNVNMITESETCQEVSDHKCSSYSCNV